MALQLPALGGLAEALPSRAEMTGVLSNILNNKKRVLFAVAFGLFLLAMVGIRNSLLYGLGVGMGILFVSGRLGFTSGWRKMVLHRDTGNFKRQLILVALAASVFIPLFDAFDSLNKAVAPFAWSGAIGALIFGLGMQLADGCGSGTLYKTGEGSPLSQTALFFFIFGNFLATLHFDHWLNLGQIPALDTVARWGWFPALGLQLLLIAFVYGLSVLWVRSKPPAKSSGSGDFALWAALCVIVLAVFNLLLSGQMWGTVYAFGLWGAKLANSVGMDLTQYPFWNQEFALRSLKQSVFYDITTLTNLGLVLGAWIAADAKRIGTKTCLNAGMRYSPILGGLLLGYGSRLGFGCNIGAFFSGIASGSLHAWIWFLFAFIGGLVGIRFRKFLGFKD